MSLTQRRTQDCVHESACARFARRPRQINGIVYDRRSRNTSEMEKLIQAQAEDGEDLTVKFRNLAPREVFNEVIETSLPAQGTGNDLGSKRSVPFVGQVRTTGVKRRRQIGAAARDRTNRMPPQSVCFAT